MHNLVFWYICHAVKQLYNLVSFKVCLSCFYLNFKPPGWLSQVMKSQLKLKVFGSWEIKIHNNWKMQCGEKTYRLHKMKYIIIVFTPRASREEGSKVSQVTVFLAVITDGSISFKLYCKVCNIDRLIQIKLSYIPMSIKKTIFCILMNLLY